MKTRNGKIARLPKAVRRVLHCWLNERDGVKEGVGELADPRVKPG
jgi:hypothetical protein